MLLVCFCVQSIYLFMDFAVALCVHRKHAVCHIKREGSGGERRLADVSRPLSSGTNAHRHEHKTTVKNYCSIFEWQPLQLNYSWQKVSSNDKWQHFWLPKWRNKWTQKPLRHTHIYVYSIHTNAHLKIHANCAHNKWLPAHFSGKRK